MDKENAPDKRRVLIVDDEQGIVNAVRRELSMIPLGRHRYEVEVFTNPKLALERALTQEFEVVLSDYRMPEMDGLDFLLALAKIQPDCARIVLSGQTELNSLIRMINETHIYRFIPKPWNSYFLKSSVAQAVNLRQSNLDNRRLAKVLRDNGISLPVGAVNEIDQILVVDSDVNGGKRIADCLQRRSELDEVFREVRADFQHGHAPMINPAQIKIQVAESALRALQLADEVSFSCVISDNRLPGVGGTEFLTNFSEKQPDCACIMLSGEANMESVVIALDLAQIHAFIAKPWSDFELRAAVAQTLVRRHKLLENRLLAQMCKARNLGAVD